MKKAIIFMLIFFCLFFANAFSQYEFNDVVKPDFVPMYESWQLNPSKTVLEYTEIVVLAVDSGASTVIQPWFGELMSELPAYFNQASFGHFIYDNIVLKKDATHAFMMPEYHLPAYTGGCEHVHLMSNIEAVLDSADLIYDFNDFDFDGDGIVYLHFTSIGPNSGGVAGTCLYYTSNDTTPSGNPVYLRVNKQSRGRNSFWYENVFYHESGHDFFAFPDMDHSGSNNYRTEVPRSGCGLTVKV